MKIPAHKQSRVDELLRDAEFRRATTVREQVCSAEGILRKGAKGDRLSYREIGAIFDFPNAGSVFNHLSQGAGPAQAPHRPSLLPDEAIELHS
jgi:hypothetical protein